MMYCSSHKQNKIRTVCTKYYEYIYTSKETEEMLHKEGYVNLKID